MPATFFKIDANNILLDVINTNPVSEVFYYTGGYAELIRAVRQANMQPGKLIMEGKGFTRINLKMEKLTDF